MIVAVSTDNAMVSAHFGRCPQFTIAHIENAKVLKRETVANPGHEPGFLPRFLKDKNVSVIIAGGMGHRAQTLFDEVGIKTILGVEGKVETVLRSFAEGKLAGGESKCIPQSGKGYGIEKNICDHGGEK
jgi:predicted Fe-Mo cluster-binding NifX family protein